MNLEAVYKLLTKENEDLRAKLNIAEKALNEIGHYGIDTGHGKYDCDFVKIAQEAHTKITAKDAES